jgi:hypothetical protein
MRNNKKATLAENVLRKYIRNEIKKLMEADEEQSTEETPEAEPEPEEEEGLNADFDAATSRYIGKLKDSSDSVEESDLIDMVSTIISAFAGSSEQKLNVLKAVKTNIVR